LIANTRRKLAACKEIVDGAPSEDGINAEKAEVDQQLVSYQ
jgi:hypothetical protein